MSDEKKTSKLGAKDYDSVAAVLAEENLENPLAPPPVKAVDNLSDKGKFHAQNIVDAAPKSSDEDEFGVAVGKQYGVTGRTAEEAEAIRIEAQRLQAEVDENG